MLASHWLPPVRLPGDSIHVSLPSANHNQGVARGKKHAKQRAAQLMLQKLHPNIGTWGQLVRLYGPQELKVTVRYP
jgi:hypothetical protein